MLLIIANPPLKADGGTGYLLWRFPIVDGKDLNRKQTIENVLKKSTAPMSLRQLHMVLKGVSIHTIQKGVKNLLSEGRIDIIGNTKGARYVYKCRFGREQMLEHDSSYRIRTSHQREGKRRVSA
ncbi:MAG: hypothetical protein IKR86_00845 [Candidatus Methanomethylophilaceae archaeon]|nr:hypothetical protein [Candidatus Methanomethylophilaceae archaeon]